MNKKEHHDAGYTGYDAKFDNAWELYLKRRDKKSFQLEKKDFRCPCCGNTLVKNGFLKRINRLFMDLNEDIDFDEGSTYRCESYNAIKGGSKHSAHITGEAVDIPAKSARVKRKIVNIAVNMGFQGIGVYNGHIHLDDKERWHATPVIWSGVSK